MFEDIKKEARAKLMQCPDAGLAEFIRQTADDLNWAAGEAVRRELIVSYRIKAPEHGNELKAPRIIVSVMSEVA